MSYFYVFGSVRDRLLLHLDKHSKQVLTLVVLGKDITRSLVSFWLGRIDGDEVKTFTEADILVETVPVFSLLF